MRNLYILGLYNNKYYIGLTKKTAQQRLSEHFRGRGAAWTRIHKPHCVERWIPGNFGGLDEDYLTKIYMYRHGIENVRGGTYSNVHFDRTQLLTLQREFDHNRGACLRCGSMKHWVKDCKSTVHVSGTKL